MITLFLILSCSNSKLEDSGFTQPPTVQDCPAARYSEAPLLGGVTAVSVEIPSGVLVAPWVQFHADSLWVECPEDGGMLTVAWEN